MSISAVIWDLGGVLVRTKNPSPREKLAVKYNMSRGELEELVFGLESGDRAQRGEITTEEHWENIRRHLNLSHQEIKSFEESFWDGDILNFKLVDYIRTLKDRYKTALLSNAFSDLRSEITEQWKIADIFDEITISAEVGMVKPDAQIYLHILHLLDTEPNQAVFIDDFAHNVEGARAVNMHAVQFINNTQTISELERILSK